MRLLRLVVPPGVSTSVVRVRILRTVPAAALGTLLLGGCAGPTTAYPSPDGKFSVEVSRSDRPPGHLWTVTVQVGVVGTVGSWPVGCLGDDVPDGVPTGVEWIGPGTFRIRTDTRKDPTVRLDASGKPAEITQPARALRDCPAA